VDVALTLRKKWEQISKEFSLRIRHHARHERTSPRIAFLLNKRQKTVKQNIIAEIDVIIKAVAGGDAEELRNLFEYTKTFCMNVNALGGPPSVPCR
jgi:hypothetical protein